jgi:signal transduction histidine kinase
MQAPLAENELKRIQDLANLNLPEHLGESFFDRYTELAAEITECPLAMVNFIEFDRQRVRSCFGADLGDMPRGESVCQYTILENDYNEIKDLSEDERFRDFPYVKNGMKLRYYLGIPIQAPNGSNIGSLCILDFEPREMEATKIKQLKLLAKEINNKLLLYSEKEHLKQVANQRSQTIKSLAHDIRNPLSGLINMVELLREETDIEDDKVESYLGMVEGNCQGLLEHLNQLSSRHKAETELQLRADWITLNGLKEKLKKLYQSRVVMKNQNLIFTLSGPSKDFETSIKEVELGINVSSYLQVIGNLLSNAIKFSERSADIEINMIIEKNPNAQELVAYHLLTEVRDYGQGLTEAQKEQLFSLQAGQKSFDGHENMGLGLFLAKQTLDQYGGSIQVDTNIEEGACIQVRFPILTQQSDS